jgi:PTH2 family peptidyl-tRNA hydrolase
MKQAIVIRTDLDMGKGKIAAQASHASISAFLKSDEYSRKAWLVHGMMKAVLKVSSEQELIEVFNRAKREKLPCALITDAGRTQLNGPTNTAVGIGPASDDAVDKITGKLKLL